MPSMIARAMLQWGRGRTATEETAAAVITSATSMLQWGRGRTATEGLHWQAATAGVVKTNRRRRRLRRPACKTNVRQK